MFLMRSIFIFLLILSGRGFAQTAESSVGISPERIPASPEMKKNVTGVHEVLSKVPDVSFEKGPLKTELLQSDYMKCDCIATEGREIESKNFAFETLDQCASERHYLQKIFDKEPLYNAFKKERAETPEDAPPRVCMTYIMRKGFGDPGMRAMRAASIGSCKMSNMKPASGANANYKACVTEDYVNIVYNSYNDVMECLSMEPKLFVPKIFNESFFHINAYNPDRKNKKGQILGGDAGIMQMTSQGIEEASREMKHTLGYIKTSVRESCQRLRPIASKIQLPLPNDLGRRCNFITAPLNPLYSYLAGVSLYQSQERDIEYRMSEFKISALLKESGFRNVNEDRLKQFLTTLSYNAGPLNAAIYLKNFLQFRIQNNKINYSNMKVAAANLQKLKKQKTPGVKALADAEKNYKDLKKKYEISLVSNEDFNFQGKDNGKPVNSFKTYLEKYQKSGSPGYLTVLAKRAINLNKTFKEDTCVSKDYLSL